MDELKKLAGVTAAKYVKNGMIVGLGTGSTAYFLLKKLDAVSKKRDCKS